MSNIKIIEPFIKSIIKTFETLCSISPDYKQPEKINLENLKTEHDFYSDISVVIPLPGSIIGSLAIAFEKQSAINIASKLMNQSFIEITKEVKDVIGEIGNTIAGNISGELEKYNFDNALPNIYFGSDKSLEMPEGFESYSVEFNSCFGIFTLRVSILDDNR